jgi:amidase
MFWRTLLFFSMVGIGQPAPAPFPVAEVGIPELRAALAAGRTTSRELVTQYLTRIALYENRLHAVITVNPKVLDEADARDRERAQGRARGPLHGIPIALKDNILTRDIVTTGGALAFAEYVPPYDATLVKHLREAGAIIIAKTTLSELANWTAGAPTPMVANYNAVRGFAYNPYDPRKDPRESGKDGRPVLSTGGSSSGAGTTVSFWAANVGTETSGSILSPANQNMLAAIKPTVGRVSRYGVIPITADQDTAGPMARTVTDAAILLGALEGVDPQDPATKRCAPPPGGDYTKFLKAGALRGARIGIPRAYYYDKLPESPRGGLSDEEGRVMTEAIDVLKQAGAVIVDPADIPGVLAKEPDKNVIRWGTCGGADNSKGRNANCSTSFAYGMKRDFNAWLGTLGPSAPVKSLTELREWNIRNTAAGAIRFGQSRLDISDEIDLVADKARYDADRARDVELAGAQGMDAVMKAHNLDAVLFPGANGAAIAARPGYPTVIVPFGMVTNALTPPGPAGFVAGPAPLGVSFAGGACSEPRLIELGYAFEQATKRRVAPAGFR